MRKLLSRIIGVGLGIWLSTLFVPRVVIEIYPDSNFFGITLTERWHLFVLFGIILGLLNFFIKPILDIISFPVRIISLGFFGFIVNMFIIWIVDAIFREISVPLFFPLFWTTLVIWILNIAAAGFILKKD